MRGGRNGDSLLQPVVIGPLAHGGLEPRDKGTHFVPAVQDLRPAVYEVSLELAFLEVPQRQEGGQTLHLAQKGGQVPG